MWIAPLVSPPFAGHNFSQIIQAQLGDKTRIDKLLDIPYEYTSKNKANPVKTIFAAAASLAQFFSKQDACMAAAITNVIFPSKYI